MFRILRAGPDNFSTQILPPDMTQKIKLNILGPNLTGLYSKSCSEKRIASFISGLNIKNGVKESHMFETKWQNGKCYVKNIVW